MTYSVPHRVETERLVIRRLERADAEAMVETVTRNMEHLRRYMSWTEHEPQTVEQRRDFIDQSRAEFDAGQDYAMGIFSLDGQFIGGTGFHVHYGPARLEIGYWIDAAHEGKGLVTEVASALTHVGLELTGATIVAIAHAPSNTRSASVPERLGFVRQDQPAHDCFDSGEMVEGVMWWATWDHLTREPLRSHPRPRAFDAQGDELPWPS